MSLYLQGKRILLVEDNDFNIEIAKTLLEKAGAEVSIEKNGRMAVETFENSDSGRYDFILMDIEMPQMNGWEATERIRALEHPQAKTIPIFAVTTNTSASDIKRCWEAGINEHIAKPLDTNKLISVMKRYI